MAVCLIEVPYMCGDEHHPAGRGPGRYLQAGAEKLLRNKGIEVTAARAERLRPRSPDPPAMSFAVNERLANTVRTALAREQLSLVLAGSCDAAIGVLAGIEGCGVVWIDAHGDFNTPSSSVSGFFPGMSLAVVTGHCFQDQWAEIGARRPIDEGSTLMIGVRDLSPEEERARLLSSRITVVGWRDGKPESDIGEALDHLAARVDTVYLHIDNDAFDPRVAPGITDHPAPEGLTLEDMERTIRAVAARFKVEAAALTNYNPSHDEDDKTLKAGLRVLDVLGECLR